jgi:hypothetical protein
LEELRNASGRSDPSLTSRSRAALRGIFSKWQSMVMGRLNYRTAVL